MTIWDAAEAALTPLAIPMGAEEFYAPDGELPDQYLAYSLVSGVGLAYADNQEASRQYRLQVSFYSRGGFSEADLAAIRSVMRAGGFTRGPDHPLPFVPETGHYGVAMDFFFLAEEQTP